MLTPGTRRQASRRTRWLPAAGGLLLALSAGAHHSGSMYEPVPVWLEGTVVQFDNINPHSLTVIEAVAADGSAIRWGIEGPPRQAIGRDSLGIPAVGQAMRVCAFPYKSPEALQQMWPDVDFTTRRAGGDPEGNVAQYFAGHVMVLDGGALRFWEPHGLISACLQTAGDAAADWVAFLDTDARAHQGWCEQRHYALVALNEALSALVAEVSGRLNGPCR